MHTILIKNFSNIFLLFGLILLVPASLLAVPAQGTVQGAASVFVSGPDGVPKPMELKATKDSEGVKPVEGFALTVDNVVSTPLNGKISVFADVGVEFTGAKLTPAATEDTIDIPIVGGQISLAGIAQGVYTLDVIVGNNAYECIVVIGPLAQQVIINEITEINSQSTNVVKIFEKGKETPTPTPTPGEEPSICFFDPNDEDCDPDENGDCAEGFGRNEDGRCIPSQSCPEGFHRANDDESGRCIDEDELRQCENNGGWVEEGEFCPEDELPFCNADHSNEPCISGQEPEPEPITCEEGFILENGKCAALDSNCGGVPCTASDKEDSTTSDPVPGTSEPELTDSEETVEEIEEQEEQDAEDQEEETESDDEQSEQQ